MPASTTLQLSHRVDRTMRYARVVFAILAVVSAMTVVAALVMQWVGSDLVNWVVWIRAVFYALGGVWLLTLVDKARRRADRAAFVRIRLISVLAPLGIAALVISPDSGYPVWMKVEQAFFGILLVPIAIGLLRPSASREFPKT